MTEQEHKCVCGKVCKNGRALHAHKLTCRKADGGTPAATCCDDPDYKLLGKLAGTEWAHLIPTARAQGHKEFCDNCGEMR